MLTRRWFSGCALCAGMALIAGDTHAQAAGFRRTILNKAEFPGDRYATILVSVEVDPGALIARHTHPGVESAIIAEGGGTLGVAGQPDRILKPGDGYQIAPETPHLLRNGDKPTRISATYVVEKDKPLASPAPE